MKAIERSFPPYFLEHRSQVCQSAVVQLPGLPIWFLQSPGGWSVNSIVIEGDDGVIVYDTGVCHEQGEAIAAEIRKITTKPIRAILYSHHHADHCQGTDALVSRERVASGDVQVIAWKTFSKEYADENRVVGPIMGMRAVFMYGALLGPDEQSYTGLGSRFVGGRIEQFIEPNRLLEEDTEIEIAGVKLRVFLTGGEASSEMGVHLPDFRVAIIADEVYAAMANLYTLRGAKFRDATRWAAASDRVLELDVDVLVGCHMPPITGAENIRRVLTTYRDAIQYNHDQAVRRILAGATPEDLRAELTELPGFLDLPPYTREMYGKVAANAAQQFTGYLGWFDGDAATLAPTPRAERARRMVALMGGRDALFAEAEKAFDADDPQWAAELAGLLISVDRGDGEAKRLKGASLRALGYRELNATWRNWYLTGAMELEGRADPNVLSGFARASFLSAAIGAEALLDALRFTIDPHRALDRHEFASIHLTDTGETWTLELRNSVLLVHAGARRDPSCEIHLSLASLAKLVSGGAAFGELVEAAELEVREPADDAAAFFGVFETAPQTAGFHTR